MIKKISISFIIVFLFALPVLAQEWIVPENEAAQKNPSAYNLENVKKGKALYLLNCKSCHGDPGKHNGLPLVPAPPDVTSELMQDNSEGALFYKITHGKGGMPKFEKTISEDDRWRLVNFIRNYNTENTPLLVEAPPVKAKLLASVNEPAKKVEVFAEFEKKDGSYSKLAEVPVTISAKKAFGNLKIGEVNTNAEGRAEFEIPETVIGDENGLVSIVVALNENYITDEVVLEAAKVGQPKHVQHLIQKGKILWSTNENIQIWLLLAYLGSAGAAWLAIAYVIYQLFKIKKLSKR